MKSIAMERKKYFPFSRADRQDRERLSLFPCLVLNLPYGRTHAIKPEQKQ